MVNCYKLRDIISGVYQIQFCVP